LSLIMFCCVAVDVSFPALTQFVLVDVGRRPVDWVNPFMCILA